MRAALTTVGRWLSVLVLAVGALLSIDLSPGLAQERGQVLAPQTPTATPVAPTPVPPTATPSPEPPETSTPETATDAEEPTESVGEADSARPPAPADTVVRAATPDDLLPLTELIYPVPADQPADYALQTGHFFSQAVPGAKPGYGFSVVDAAGVPLWTEYQRHGGLASLGYPISRRFIHSSSVAQAFQNGVLVWNAPVGRANVIVLAHGEKLPEHSVEPEPPARLGTWAAHQPWSGWWWPANSRVRGPYLFDNNGPLAKYDRYVMTIGGGNPGTRDWEHSELRFDGLQWAGHCNGWAAAALLEPEPTQPIEVGGIRFSVADQKGLLSSYHFADAALWLHGGDAEMSPLELHYRLLEWLGNRKKGFIVTFRPAQNDEVWSYPVYRFELTMSPDRLEPDVTNVTAALWLSDNNVQPDFVGLRPWKGEPQLYHYRLHGPREAPTGGEWTGTSVSGAFARPWTIWYPDPNARNLDRVLTSPNLDYEMIQSILRGQ